MKRGRSVPKTDITGAVKLLREAKRWRKVQLVRWVVPALRGYTLWMRSDLPPMVPLDLREWKDPKKKVAPHGLWVNTNLVALVAGQVGHASLPTCAVLPLDEWSDTPPMWDNLGWAQWSEKRKVPKLKRVTRKTPCQFAEIAKP